MSRIEVKLPFKGKHCETTMLGVLMSHIGYKLSEPMLFGLGQGIGYGIITWGSDGIPFIGGRTKTVEISRNLSQNLKLEMVTNQTTSVKKAWNAVKENLDQGIPVGLQLDSYHLQYFKNKIHFAGHFAVIIGYDDKDAYLVDSNQEGEYVKTSLESLSLARNEKGPMHGKNLSIVLQKGEVEVPLEEALRVAIRNNANDFLNPPISNFGYKGIARTAKELKKWFKNSDDVKKDFTFTAMMMEKAGTGGALFRNIYRDFLAEANEILQDEKVERGYQLYKESAKMWSQVSELFNLVGETGDEKYLDEARVVLLKIEKIEVEAMTILKEI